MMWLFLALCVAVLTSLQDILAKRLSTQVSPYVTAWAWLFFSLPLLFFFLPQEFPIHLGKNFWIALISGTISLTIASLFLFKAITASELSLSIPMLSFTPLFLLITSPLIVGEFPSFLGLVGIIFILIGSYVLFFNPQQEGFLAPFVRLISYRGSRYMLIVAFLFSIGGNIDKIGVLESSPIIWSLSLNACVAFFLGIVMMLKVKNPMQEIRSHLLFFFLIGGVLSLVMIFQMQALLLSKVPYVLTVKRLSIVMTSLWGVWFLKEQGGKKRLLAILLMIVGVVLIAFGK